MDLSPAFRAELIGGGQIVMLAVLFSAIAQNGIYIFQLVVAGHQLGRRRPVLNAYRLWERLAPVAPGCTIIAPAYNEERTIVDSVYAMLSQRYPDVDIIVVNDGSRDSTLDLLIEFFELEEIALPDALALAHAPIRRVFQSRIVERLRVIDKENGGKGDAQNAGINLCHAPLCCIMDGDTLLEPDALIRVVAPFVEDPERVIAVGGTIRIANGSDIADGQVKGVRMPRGLAARVQIVEYLRAFLLGRLAWARIGASPLISGAFGMFRRDVLIEVGGYTRGSMGEDLDLVLKLHRHMRREKRPYRIAFVPEPVCWTEVPASYAVLGRQRARWQNGALESFFRYRGMALNPRYGRIGFAVFGQMLLVDVLGPPVEVLGYATLPLFWLLGALNGWSLLVLTALVFALGTFATMGSLILAELELRPYPRTRDLLILGSTAIVENFGYRQLHNFWRLRGYWQFLRARKTWGEMPRAGFGTQAGGLQSNEGDAR